MSHDGYDRLPVHWFPHIDLSERKDRNKEINTIDFLNNPAKSLSGFSPLYVQTIILELAARKLAKMPNCDI